MSGCEQFNPDNIFKRFKVVEFPTSFVGLSTSQELDVEVDLETSAFLKTMYEGRLWIFDEAREVSASHRAFEISPINEHTINITFKPLSECISRVKKYRKQFENRFVFDLRLIKAYGTRCCNNELHSEIGRYYISGQFEYCTISHLPKIVDFGNVATNSKVTKYVRLKNESQLVPAKMFNVKKTAFQVTPTQFTIPPNSSKRIEITLRATSLNVGNTLVFKIRNPHDMYEHAPFVEEMTTDDNFISYTITIECKVIHKSIRKDIVVASLHNLYEQSPNYTYLNEELTVRKTRNDIALQFLTISKSNHVSKPTIEKFSSGKEICYSEPPSKFNITKEDFCKKICLKVSTHEILNILINPFFIDFGRIGLHTYGEQDVKIKNDTKYDITVKLLPNKCVLYNPEKVEQIIKLKSFTEATVTLFCYGIKEGINAGTFKYTIDNKFHREHPYCLLVENPALCVQDTNLKFGMVTTEGFVTSVPVRIYNNFNVPVNYQWGELQQDIPFEIAPKSGTIPKHGCRLCDITYVCKTTKSKTHDIEFYSLGDVTKVIPIEISVMTRKLSIKFLQPAVLFKDIALNLETVETVKLENSSREIALFHIVEPLIPGLRIEPMSGTIRPKIIMTFEIIVKISCVLEFAFDVYLKINNKENVILPISGNVVEPKVIIHPKNIYMSRIPCGMITYVPITFQNLSSLRTVVEVLDTGDENIFNVYTANGNERQRVLEFFIDGGQNKTVFLKVFDIFRREYEMYIPFKINGLLGPPDFDSWSTELQHYIGPYEQFYENNLRVKVKSLNKDICFCRITGVITVPWIQFSVEKFEIDYVPNGNNCINFTMTNISKYYLHVAILTSKLAPSFTLDLRTEENQSIINETNIKFELNRGKEATFCLKFHPKGHGRFVSVAVLFLDKYLTLPYYNMTFIGKRQTPAMTPSTHQVIFPPCYVGRKIFRFITVKIEMEAELDSFTCSSKEEPNISIDFIKCEVFQEGEEFYTTLTIKIAVCCQIAYARNLPLSFNHEGGSGCEVEVNFCFTYCPLTLHTRPYVVPEDNPYPYYPLSTQTDLYEYLEQCSSFLEKWMFQQGFRRDLFPIIPDTFYAISATISTQGAKSKGINVSYLNFVKRIAGPLMKHVHKISVTGVDESFKNIKEIHDTYREIINLLKSRGANLWVVQAKFLLSYNQFISWTENVTPKCNADIILIQKLLADVDLFNRLSKQSWIDFILQSYKVFVMDSCFFDCVCVSSQPRDIIKILIDWYNEHILIQHHTLRGKDKPVKVMTNITTDLSDGIAIISTFLNHCPFLEEHFSVVCEVDESNREAGIINNGCLIIEAMNMLRLYFPLTTMDLMEPNYLHMLFLSIHLYVTLPMFKPKDTIRFNPPLLRSSTRQVAISPTSQESLIFNYIILNNNKNNFTVEKSPSAENGRKMFISVKYIANFVYEETCMLLVHGYNKTRIFDTYITFKLIGCIGALNPIKKCKVTGPLYRPNKVDILVSSPFTATAVYEIYLTDIEPTIPVVFEEHHKQRFYVRRLNLIDREIILNGVPKDLTSSQEVQEHKLYLQMICLSTQVGNTWIWFRSEVGEFFLRVTTQSRWDIALDTLQAKVQTWPMDPCSCGEACECYRTTTLMIPHRNELMLKALRYALFENASEVMMQIFDELIESTTGKIILGMLLIEGGTNITEVNHILRRENTYRITSRTLLPRLDRVTLAQHTDAVLALPVTAPPHDKSEKYAVTFTSDCGMDIRNYRIIFIETTMDRLSSEPILKNQVK